MVKIWNKGTKSCRMKYINKFDTFEWQKWKDKNHIPRKKVIDMLLFVLKSQRPIMYERYDRQTSQVCGMDVLIYYSIKVCHYQSIKNAISFLYRARKNKPNISLNSVSSVLSNSLLKSTLERSKLFLHFYLFSIKTDPSIIYLAIQPDVIKTLHGAEVF